MHLRNTLLLITTILTAALASAVPEPVPVPDGTDPDCTPLPKKCHKAAHSYCNAVLTTATSTTTTTAFAPCFQCSGYEPNPPACTPPPDSNNIATPAKRAPERKKMPIPPCFRKYVSAADDPALTSACSCAGVPQSTQTTSTVTQTAHATAFYLGYGVQPGTIADHFAEQTEYDGEDPVAQFDLTTRAGASIYTLDDQCHLIDSQGRMGYAVSAQHQIAHWRYPADAQSNEIPVVCYVGGEPKNRDASGMGCRPGYASGLVDFGLNDDLVWWTEAVNGHSSSTEIYPDGTQGDYKGQGQ